MVYSKCQCLSAFCLPFCAIIVVHVPFPFGVWGRVLNSIILVPDHYLFMYPICA